MQQLYRSILLPQAYTLLANIQKISAFSDFYLAGGTALSLWIGHRKSVDLDFFTSKEFSSTLVSKLPYSYQIIALHDNSIELIVSDVKVFFFYFAFQQYKKFHTIEQIRLADPIDIGLMKLLALQGRTSWKDIVDLYYIDKKILPLEKLLILFNNHYPKESFNAYDSLRTLLDTKDLANQPYPEMFEETDFDECLKVVEKKLTSFIMKKLKRKNFGPSQSTVSDKRQATP